MRPSSTSAAVALAAALALMAVPAAADPAGPTPDPAGAPVTAVPLGATTSQPAAPAEVAAQPVAAQPAAPAEVAALSVASATTGDGHIRIRATSNAESVRVRFRTAAAEEAVVTEEVRDGQAEFTLEPGSTSIEVRARATAELAASPWAGISDVPAAEPTPGRTYWVTPSSPILGKLAGYKSVNKYTRDYYMIRSHMERFEDEGGGTLVLGPGRYEISSTIYVPSNTTIQLSEGTTLVKLDRTGTKKFSASNSMFMLIRPSKGKEPGAVGGHDGEANITIAGAGAGRSVIDLDSIRNSLAIIAGHNRDVTISGITFRQMNNNHFIEMDACADCTITGNEFLDAATGSRHTAEAINLDTPDPRTGGFGSIWSRQDETPNERVTISANRFDGMPRALGTHNFSAGRYHTDIVVTGNTITDNADDAIHIMNWANPVFLGNTISASPGSVGLRACGTTNPTITGNTFADSAAAVLFRSCTGENGTTLANDVAEQNVSQLRTNLLGQGLDTAAVGVPGVGDVLFDASERPPDAVPSQPLVESVTAGDRQVAVRWSPALADESAPITGYRIRVSDNPDGEPVQTFDAPADAGEAVVTGLVNGTTHHVTVAAVSSAGESPTGPWARPTATPQGPPSAPLEATGGSPLIGGVELTWKPAANDGGQPITAYRVHIYADADASQPLPGSPVELHPDTSAHSWAGLTEGTTYYVRVTAVNSLGEGAPSGLVPVVAMSTPAAVAPVL